MSMSVEEWNGLVKKALDSSEDQSTVISVLTQARDEYSALFSEKVNLDEQLATTKAENERLKDTNMQLFLRIGQTLADTKDSVPNLKESREETIRIEDLFKDEK